MTEGMQFRCAWCPDTLTFIPGIGWVHHDGVTIRTRIREDGELVDDHVALPVRDHPAMRHA